MLSYEIFDRLEPIRALSEYRRKELVAFSRLQTYPLGSDPLALCLEANTLIYLHRGELLIGQHDGSSRVLVGGCDIANWPIGHTSFPLARSKAITEVELLHIDFEMLDIMITWDEVTVAASRQDVADVSLVPAWRTLTGVFSAQTLNSDVLRRLPAAHIHELLHRFERRAVQSGQIIVREGDQGEDYFLIESGRAEVRKVIGGVDLCVAELKSGDAFGEEALLCDSPRNATIVMKTEGVLWRLGKADFVPLLQEPLLRAIDRSDAEQRVASGLARWLDVRYPVEFVEDGLPGALNLPLNEIRSAFGLLDRRPEYIVYCQSGRRSSAATFLLAQHGFRAVMLKGGLGLAETA